MAVNEQFRNANHVSLPVPAGTKSGDPVRVGVLNGVAQTNVATDTDWAGGNPAGHASVWLDGSFVLPVTGAVAEVGAPIYIDDDGALSASGSVLFGAALATQTATGDLAVKILQPGAGDAAGEA